MRRERERTFTTTLPEFPGRSPSSSADVGMEANIALPESRFSGEVVSRWDEEVIRS